MNYADEIHHYLRTRPTFQQVCESAVDQARQEIEAMDRLAQITHDRINRASSLARLIGRWDAAEADLARVIGQTPPPLPAAHRAA